MTSSLRHRPIAFATAQTAQARKGLGNDPERNSATSRRRAGRGLRRRPEWNEAFDSLQYALRHMPMSHLTLSLFWLLLAWDKKNATEKGRADFASALGCGVAALREEGG